MRINQKILSIPPYISTAWKNVISLHVEQIEGTLVLIIGLYNGSSIEIPHLEKNVVDAVFAAHEKFLEQEAASNLPQKNSTPSTIFPSGLSDESSTIVSLPIRFGVEGNMGNLLQHNPEAANSPDLPPEMLEKISSISKAVGFENTDQFPKPEPHCNCMHCQIMRKIHDDGSSQKIETPHSQEEEVSEEDLKFREWDIKPFEEQFFLVTNPLTPQETYTVFLGNPIGCTCGKSDCEHIRAVLNS